MGSFNCAFVTVFRSVESNSNIRGTKFTRAVLERPRDVYMTQVGW